MYVKDPATYSVDEVCLFLNAIGLGDKAGEFRNQSVDGSLLVALTPEDMGELGVSGLQGKKIANALQFTKSLASGGGGGGGGNDSRVAQLEAENAHLKRELAYYKPAPAPAKAPAPAYAPAPAPMRQEHHVIRGAAGGAAKGAVLGAVAGAITGDPGQGAKVGAAVGATAGGMSGLGARRRARLLR